MTKAELRDAIAVQIAAYATAPLSDLEVKNRPQADYEDADGSVVISYEGGEERPIGIGDQFYDVHTFRIIARIPFTEAHADIENICKQLRYVLRDNRQISAGGDTARLISAMEWNDEMWDADNERLLNECFVVVTYQVKQEATS